MPRIPSTLIAPVALAVVAGSLLLAGNLLADKSADVDKLNKKIDSFTLKDAAGKPFSLASFKGKKAVVVVFLSFECPVSRNYSSVLAELHKTCSGKDVAFLAID